MSSNWSPDDEKAPRCVGYGKFDGRWNAAGGDDQRGFVEYKGSWRTPQEIQILDEQRAAELGEKTWFNNLERWRTGWAATANRKVRRSILAIRDPLAIPALKKAMEIEEDEHVRQLLAEALAGTGSSLALHVLADRSLDDPSEEVRLTCLELPGQSSKWRCGGCLYSPLARPPIIRSCVGPPSAWPR